MFEGFSNLKLTRPLTILDLETTGVDVKNDRIVEFAALRATPDGDTRVIGVRINPGIPIPASATAVHGIRDCDVADCRPFADYAESLHELLRNTDLCGFNLKQFDIPLLVEEFARCGFSFSIKGRRVIDAYQIICEREPRDLKSAHRFYCGREHENAHAAHHDVDATALVLDA